MEPSKQKVKDPVHLDDTIVAALHHLAEKTIHKEYHGRLDASAMICCSLVAHDLIDTFLNEKTPSFNPTVPTNECMSCLNEWSRDPPLNKKVKLEPTTIFRFHRLFIHKLEDHRLVLLCLHCIRRLKASHAYCPHCLNIPSIYKFKHARVKDPVTGLESYVCDRCDFHYSKVEKKDSLLNAVSSSQLDPQAILNVNDLGFR